MSNNDGQLFTPYNGTGGYVERPASIARAVDEVQNGTLSKRQADVLHYLYEANLQGATWQSVATALALHHGQTSGVLSNLHKAGEVFMLRVRRNGCHPYVYKSFRSYYTDDEVFDTPATTRAGERRNLLEQLLEQCLRAPGQTDAIKQLVDKVLAHDARTTSTQG